jgi:membrane associated rhomboid family serine protease
MGLLEYWGHFSGDTAIWHGQIWRFISFQFLHASFFHIFFNMLALYFFGPMIERYLGSRRYLAFYLISGVAGAVGYLLLWATGLIYAHPGVPLVGASAGVFGVLIAGALVAPNTTVMLLIPPIPIKLSTLAWILVGIAAFTVLFYGDRPGSNAGGEAAHLGGAAMGWLLIRRPHLLRWAEGLGDGSKQSMRQRIERHLQERREDKQAQLEEEVDRILLKVSQQGLGSLTEREKRTLRNATESRRDRR